MAGIYARAFPQNRPWSADEIAALAAAPGFACQDEVGFALGRAVAGEAELLTIAVPPEAQGRGHGRKLLCAFEGAAAARGASRAFLEVAEDNTAARALYDAAGWQRIARREKYYSRAHGPQIAALIYEKIIVNARNLLKTPVSG